MASTSGFDFIPSTVGAAQPRPHRPRARNRPAPKTETVLLLPKDRDSSPCTRRASSRKGILRPRSRSALHGRELLVRPEVLTHRLWHDESGGHTSFPQGAGEVPRVTTNSCKEQHFWPAPQIRSVRARLHAHGARRA